MCLSAEAGELVRIIENVAIPVFGGTEPNAGRQLSSAQIGYLYRTAKALVILNLLDAVFTLYWIRAGLAEEANAFMRDLVVNNALGFVLAKIALVSLGAVLLWRCHKHPFAALALTGCCVLYFLVLLHHLRFSGVLLLG